MIIAFKERLTIWILAKVVSENEAIANDIKKGNQGKAGILVGKVIKIIGKGASGKVIREEILKAVSNSSLAISKQPRANSQEVIASKEKQKGKTEETLPEIPIVINTSAKKTSGKQDRQKG